MEIPHTTNPPAPPRVESPGVRHLISSWHTARGGLIFAGLAAVAGGMAIGWNWLTAIGVVPLILSLAPCAAMCALGLCVVARASSRGSYQGSAMKTPSTPATKD